MKKLVDIINSEGTILGLYQSSSSSKEFYFGSILKDGSGRIFYRVTKKMIKDYHESNITLISVLDKSPDLVVENRFREKSLSYLKDDVKHLIQSGGKFYEEINENMKSKEFSDWIVNIDL